VTLRSDGSKSGGLRRRETAALVLVRLLLLPGVMWAVVEAEEAMGLLPQGVEAPLYKYVLLIQNAVPTSLTVGTVLQLVAAPNDPRMRLFAHQMVLQLVCYIPVMTLYLTLVFHALNDRESQQGAAL